MIENNQNNFKSATNREQTNLAINWAVVESYTSIRRNKINNINDDKNNKNINIQNTSQVNQDNKVKKVKTLPSYSLCRQFDFYLSSHIKHFDLPLSINNTSLNYLINYQNKENKENKDSNESIEIKKSIQSQGKSTLTKNFAISSSSIFIGAGQNLKGMRIHLSNHKNNIVHKEINDFKISKSKSIEKVEINLSEKKNDKNDKNEQLLSSLETINKRWKQAEKKYKTRLSYISNNETIFLNKKKYIDELIDKININSTSNKNNNSQKYYILIKQDKQNKNYQFIHEIISPTSSEELETSINKFISQDNDNNKENINIYKYKYNKRTSQNHIYFNETKKKSKFQSKDISNENSQNNLNNDISFQKEYFNPIFIFSQKQIKDLSEIIDKKTNQKKEKNNYSINNNTSLNYTKNTKNKLQNQKKKNLKI